MKERLEQWRINEIAISWLGKYLSLLRRDQAAEPKRKILLLLAVKMCFRSVPVGVSLMLIRAKFAETKNLLI